VITKIIDLLIAIPSIIRFIKQLMDLVAEQRAKAAVEAAKRAVDKSVETGDQRELEKAIGSENAGRPTDDKIPELRERPVRNRTT
jgi:hypothetical protein